jgi:hypothetical protein
MRFLQVHPRWPPVHRSLSVVKRRLETGASAASHPACGARPYGEAASRERRTSGMVRAKASYRTRCQTPHAPVSRAAIKSNIRRNRIHESSRRFIAVSIAPRPLDRAANRRHWQCRTGFRNTQKVLFRQDSSTGRACIVGIAPQRASRSPENRTGPFHCSRQCKRERFRGDIFGYGGSMPSKPEP